MKLNTFAKTAFVGDYWDYTSEQDIAGGTVEPTFFFDGVIAGVVQTEGQSGQVIFYSTRQLRRNAQIRNLRDARAKFVYTDRLGAPQILYVDSIEPVFNVWSQVDGYRHSLVRAG